MGTRQQESKYKEAVGKNQTTASSKKSTPPPGFSKFRFAYCLLPTSFPTTSLSMVEGSGGEAAVIEGTDVAGTQAKQVKTELDTRPTGIGGAIHCHA